MAQAAAMESEILRSDVPEGGTGVTLLGGTLFRREDYNADLNGQKGTLVYEKMRRGDPDVASGLANLIQPILSTPIEFEPAEDTKEEREIAEFCDKWIFGTGRTDPFAMNKQAFLRHALLMVSDGFSAFEKVWGVDREGRDVYAQLIPILPKTVVEFQFANRPGGGLEYAKQRAYVLGKGYVDAKVRAEKLILFVFAREGDNLFGWPILRAAYKPWYHKETIEVIDGIRIERNGVGFVVITIPRGAKANVREAAQKVATEMRANQRMGVIVEEGTKVEILYPSGADPKIVESLQFLRSQILQVMLSEFVEHGSSNVGSKALVGDKMDLLEMKLQGLGADVCDVLNRQAVPELVWRNWGPRKKYPKAKFGDINRTSIVQLAETLSKLVPANVITMDPELQQFIREAAGWPLIPEKDMKRLREAHDKSLDMKVEMAGQPPMIEPQADGGAPGQNGTPPKPRLVESKAAHREAALVPGPFWRDLLPHEMSADFVGMKSHLMSEPGRVYKNIVKSMRETMAWAAAGRVAAMSIAELKKGTVATIPQQPKLAKRLEEPFIETYLKGREAVVAERARQLAGPIKAAQDTEEDEDGFPIEPTKDQLGIVKLLAAGFVVGLFRGMQRRAGDEALAVVTLTELSQVEKRQRIYEAIMGLSENVIQNELAGGLIRAFGTGRNDQAEAMGEEISSAFYSAVMDDNTCGPCALLDGDQHELGDPAYQAPNPDCLGGANCRCVTVYVFREAKQEEAA